MYSSERPSHKMTFLVGVLPLPKAEKFNMAHCLAYLALLDLHVVSGLRFCECVTLRLCPFARLWVIVTKYNVSLATVCECLGILVKTSYACDTRID